MNVTRLSFTHAQQEKSNKLKKLLVPVSAPEKKPKEHLSMAEIDRMFAPKGGLYKMHTKR